MDGDSINDNQSDEGSESEEENTLDKDTSYNCDQCSFKTTRKYHLARHVDSVHGETRYSCDICDYQAKRKDNLKKHKVTVHEWVTETPTKSKKKKKKAQNKSKRSKNISPSPEPFYGFTAPEIQRSACLLYTSPRPRDS